MVGEIRDPVEIGFFSSLVEESSKADESVGRFINGAKRNQTTMFGHAGMTLNEMCDFYMNIIQVFFAEERDLQI